MSLKIWHISDTHTYHKLLKVPEVDMVIHSGDFSNARDVYANEPEMRDFITWFGSLPIKYKVLIAGNHDAYAFARNRDFRELCEHYNITYLNEQSVEIEGINIYGSAWTPTFGNWYFQRDRAKMNKAWCDIPDNTNILVVHGPPKGILDATYNRDHQIEFVGCSALRGHILKRLDLKFCLFGHVHNDDDILNAGVLKLANKGRTVFSNGSVVTDKKFGTLSSNGNLLLFNN